MVAADVDGNGSVDAAEMKALCSKMGVEASDEDIAKEMAAFDVNKDGKITSGELQQYLSEMVGRQAMGLNRTQNTQLFGDANKVLVGR